MGVDIDRLSKVEKVFGLCKSILQNTQAPGLDYYQDAMY